VASASGDWVLLRDGRVGMVNYALRTPDSPVRFAVSFPGVPLLFNGAQKGANTSASASNQLIVGEEEVLKALEVTCQMIMGGESSSGTIYDLESGTTYTIQLFACALDGVQSGFDVRSITTPKASPGFGAHGFKAASYDKVNEQTDSLIKIELAPLKPPILYLFLAHSTV